jgi:hypothetical protein
MGGVELSADRDGARVRLSRRVLLGREKCHESFRCPSDSKGGPSGSVVLKVRFRARLDVFV